MTVPVARPMWLGPYTSEAAAGFDRALSAGFTTGRALVVGQIASFRDCWAFRGVIAGRLGLSVRTVQRAITAAHESGLIGKARGKKDEIPTGAKAPIPCGWTHRWTVGWGQAEAAARAAIAAARLSRLVKAMTKKVETSSEKPSPADVQAAARKQLAEE